MRLLCNLNTKPPAKIEGVVLVGKLAAIKLICNHARSMVGPTADSVAQTLGPPLHHIALWDGQVSPTSGTFFISCLEQECVNPTGRY